MDKSREKAKTKGEESRSTDKRQAEDEVKAVNPKKKHKNEKSKKKDSMSSHSVPIEVALSSIKADIGFLKVSVDSIKEDVESIKTRVNSLQSSVDLLPTKDDLLAISPSSKAPSTKETWSPSSFTPSSSNPLVILCSVKELSQSNKPSQVFAHMEPFVEVDPSGRYGRYSEAPGGSDVVQVYRAFDQEKGVIVSWHKIELGSCSTDPDKLYSELSLVKSVESKNVMTTYKVWRDKSQNSLNFITEFCSSGNLRELREKHSQISIRTVKKWSKQILKGLRDLHTHDPCIVHGYLNCSNVFVNSTIGQVKIGGVGLDAINPILDIPNFEGCAKDIYFYGLLVSELLAPYSDPAATAFIRKCTLKPMGKTAAKLLDDPFFNGISCDDKEKEEENKTIPQMSQSFWTWRMKMPYILEMPFTQDRNICWAIALTRALSALRKIHGYPEGNGRRSLSSVDLIKSIHPRCFMDENGAIILTEHARDFLVGEGLVSDMIVHHKPKNNLEDEHEEFEVLIESLLHKAPVAVSITLFPSYSKSNGKGVYTPTCEDLVRYDHELFGYHSVLLTGYGTDEHNRAYWEVQESYGKSMGDNGFVRIARHKRLIEEMVELKL